MFEEAMTKPKEFGGFYKKVGGNEGGKCHYPTRLDTYGCGCSHNCDYCYSKSLLDFRGLWNPEQPRVANIEAIEKVVKKIPQGSVVRLGGMTDCFQPCEVTYRVTYETIKLLNKYHIGYLIVTKGAIIGSDEYLDILDKDLAHIQVTVTCTNDDLYRKLDFEKASLPSERIKAIEKLQALGFDVQLRLSPFIEEYIDFDVLNNVKCDKILVEFLRVNTWIKRWFKDLDYSKWTVKQSGYQHLPLEEKKRLLEKVTGFKELTICEDCTEHYNYWRDNVIPNKNDCCNLRPTKTVVEHLERMERQKEESRKANEDKERFKLTNLI